MKGGGSEQTSISFAFSEARWIATSLAPLSPRNDKHLRTNTTLVIASPLRAWRSTGPHYPNRQTRSRLPRHDGLPRRPYCPPRNDKHLRTNTTLVIARAKPVAIHWSSVTEQTTPPASPETRWIAASLTPFPPRNDNIRTAISSFPLW